MRIAVLVFGVVVLAAVGNAKTIHVPGHYSKIQTAINVAMDGDVVLVAPGTYGENISFNGKAITVTSSHGPEVTVIDGNQNGPVVQFMFDEGPDSVLEGFTLTNGSGFYKYGYTMGGGVYCYYAHPTCRGNIITGNKVNDSGGGIFCYYSSARILDNIITDNEANLGGAIYAHHVPRIINNIMTNNLSFNRGGAIFCIDFGGTITNNTIFGNESWNEGGGICVHTAVTTVYNTIVWDNDAPNGPEVHVAFTNPVFTCCDIKGGWPGVGNIDADPLFVDPAQNDFHLYFDSPCKDKGDNATIGLEDCDFEGDPRVAFGTVDMGADEFYTHLYWTGDAAPGGNVELKFVGLPGTSPVQVWLGSGVLDPPWPTQYGDWYLQFPLLAGVPNLGAIPSKGVYLLPFTFPPDTPTPLSLPFQAGIGQELTNLSLMDVE